MNVSKRERERKNADKIGHGIILLPFGVWMCFKFFTVFLSIFLSSLWMYDSMCNQTESFRMLCVCVCYPSFLFCSFPICICALCSIHKWWVPSSRVMYRRSKANEVKCFKQITLIFHFVLCCGEQRQITYFFSAPRFFWHQKVNRVHTEQFIIWSYIKHTASVCAHTWQSQLTQIFGWFAFTHFVHRQWRIERKRNKTRC